jgi:hypothetical protein
MLVGRGRAPTLRWAPAAAGYALLVLAWVFASPFGAAPDEPAHAVRAAAAGAGQWQGRPAAPYQRGAGQTQAQADLLNQQAQEFTIPANVDAGDACFVGHPDRSAACLNAPAPGTASGSVQAVTYETTAPPGAYTLAGVAMLLPVSGLVPGYLGRLALALVCALLLAGAAWAAGVRGSLWPLAGLALAASPMVLFLSASLGTAGASSAAAICFASGLLAFWLCPPRRGLAPLIAASGAILALSSAGGALAAAALVVAMLPLVQFRRLTEPGTVLASAVVTAAIILGAALALDHRPLPAGGADLLAAASAVLRAAPVLLQQAAGVFGRSDVPLPLGVSAVWGGLVVVAASAALVLGRLRDRLALALVAAGAAAAAIVAVAFVLAPVGWELRGSFVLPILAALPLMAGFVLNAARVHPRADALLIGVVVVGVQLFALWENARRYAVGEQGPLNFLAPAQWSPPGGWMLWLVLAAAGGLLVLLALVPLTRGEADVEASGPLVVVDPISVSR